MKQIRRIAAFVLVLVFCLCFISSASASSNGKFGSTRTAGAAQYSSTQAFMDAMDEEGILYTYKGIDDDTDEWLEIVYTGDYCDDIDIVVFFKADNEQANFRFWNLIDFNSSDYREILTVVNQLNADYKWVKFVVDTRDYSVQSETDVLFRPDDVGELCLETLDHIVNISDLAYRVLEPYAIQD